MSAFRLNFEKELKQKLSQKSTANQSEENMLMRSFKYFDLDNSGSVDKDEFMKCIEKIGIQIFDKEDFYKIFDYYDVDKNGTLDYKEFTQVLFDESSSQQKNNRQQQQNNNQNQQNQQNQQQNNKGNSDNMGQVAVEKFRNKLKSRGGNGILGLGRQFRIFDDDGSRSLNNYEFKKACNDFQVGLTDAELSACFRIFDRNGDGSVDYDEFLLTVKGPMNRARKNLVSQAFNILDKDRSGEISIDDLIGIYNGKMHPDVKSGKKTEKQILTEFLNTFENYSLLTDGVVDGIVTKQEFEDYYTFISSSIDNDEYFQLMMNNAWRMNDGKNKNWNTKGYSNTKDNGNQQQQNSTQRAPFGSSNNNNNNQRPNTAQQNNQQQSQQNNQQQSQQKNNGRNQGSDQMVQKCREKILARGVRGLFSMGRLFRIIDDDNSKSLDYQEFFKFTNEYRLDLQEKEVLQLFNTFDMNGDGTVDYDEFVRIIRGPMNNKRSNLVKQAFKILDKSGDGVVDITDLKGVYNAKMHPDVKAGKKTEDEILGEFLDTFEQHMANLTGDQSQRNQSITLDEFIEYYNNISASVDDDAYFELMMNNAWKMNGTQKSYAKGWANK